MVKLTCLLVLVATMAPASASPNGHEITAIGARRVGPAWLSVSGPGTDGTYSARIDVSDLDLTQQSGRTTMVARVRRGVRDLCGVAAYGPAGMERVYRPDRAAINCSHDTYESAWPQITAMLAAIDRGEAVPRLAIAVERAERSR